MIRIANGKWKGGGPDADGDGVFEFAEPKVLPDGSTVGSIEYRNGSPVFDDYVVGKEEGIYDLWEVSGNARTDADALIRKIPEANGSYIPPDGSLYVLNHFENGQVGYVPRVIHDKRIGGVSHAGGKSMLNNDVL